MSLGRNYKNEDRLSHLPEEVVSHILSLMPTKFAVQTSILSKRWTNTWTLVTNLAFDNSDPAHRFNDPLKSVDRVLELCKTSHLKLLRLHLRRYMVESSSVQRWIDKAVRLNVCELDINVFWLQLPLSVFTCKTLTKLKLSGSHYLVDVFSSPPLITLPALKTLDIRYQTVPFVNTFAFRLISGCPVLESLSLTISFCDNEDYNFNIPTLKRLELTTHHITLVTSKIFLNVPNLEYLSIHGMLSSHFVMEDLSSLVEATITFTGPREFTSAQISQFEALGFEGVYPFQWSLVFQLHENCYDLEHLCIEEVRESCWIEPKSCWIEPKSCWIEQESVPIGIRSNLRTMKFTRCKEWNCVTRFIEYMLGKADVLEKLTITCKSLCMEDELRLCARLLKIPRASRFCEIHFVGKWLNTTGN